MPPLAKSLRLLKERGRLLLRAFSGLGLLIAIASTAFADFLVPPTSSSSETAPAIYQILKSAAAGLNSVISTDESIYLRYQPCGIPSAFFHSQSQSIVLCEELVAQIVRFDLAPMASESTKNIAVVAVIRYVIFHEVGHALIDILDLPAVGREEDAADQLATLILAQSTTTSPAWAVMYFLQSHHASAPKFLEQISALLLGSATTLYGEPSTHYANEHALDAQRFYNIFCWTYGSDPTKNETLLPSIPQQRAVRCPGEYQKLETAWESLLRPYLAIISKPDRNREGNLGSEVL